MSLIIVNVGLGDNTLIPCPKDRFESVSVKLCGECIYFKGVGKKTDAKMIEITDAATQEKYTRSIRWGEQYAVVCAHPIERSCQTFKG